METAVIGAAIAAAAAVFAAVMSWSAARRARQSQDRTHARTRIVWAASLRADDPAYDIPRTVLASIAILRWAPEDDRALAAELTGPDRPAGEEAPC